MNLGSQNGKRKHRKHTLTAKSSAILQPAGARARPHPGRSVCLVSAVRRIKWDPNEGFVWKLDRQLCCVAWFKWTAASPLVSNKKSENCLPSLPICKGSIICTLTIQLSSLLFSTSRPARCWRVVRGEAGRGCRGDSRVICLVVQAAPPAVTNKTVEIRQNCGGTVNRGAACWAGTRTCHHISILAYLTS